MLAMVYIASALYVRRTAESTVYESTALTVAAGYLEQIKSVEYESLVVSIMSPSVPLETMVNQGTKDPIYLNVYTEKTVVLNEDDSGNPNQTMTVAVMPVAVDYAPSTGERILGIEIHFKWQSPDTGAWKERVLRTSRSYVPTF